MKNTLNRDWLASYKTNPRDDPSIYKNYSNPSLSSWDTRFGSLNPSEKNKYYQFLHQIPEEVRGLTAPETQQYLQSANAQKNTLDQQKQQYNVQIQALKAEEAAKRQREQTAQQEGQREAQRQATLRAQQETQREAERQANLRRDAEAARLSNATRQAAIQDRQRRRDTKIAELRNAEAQKTSALNRFVMQSDPSNRQQMMNLSQAIDTWKNHIQRLLNEINSGNY